jgi:hypothetical protein
MPRGLLPGSSQSRSPRSVVFHKFSAGRDADDMMLERFLFGIKKLCLM